MKKSDLDSAMEFETKEAAENFENAMGLVAKLLVKYWDELSVIMEDNRKRIKNVE